VLACEGYSGAKTDGYFETAARLYSRLTSRARPRFVCARQLSTHCNAPLLRGSTTAAHSISPSRSSAARHASGCLADPGDDAERASSISKTWPTPTTTFAAYLAFKGVSGPLSTCKVLFTGNLVLDRATLGPACVDLDTRSYCEVQCAMQLDFVSMARLKAEMCKMYCGGITGKGTGRVQRSVSFHE
jgi:hypothetical protein